MKRCTKCGADFSDWKITPDDCPTCEPERYAFPGKYHPIRRGHIPYTKRFKPEFYPAFGKVVETASERRRLIKQYALEEVGGEMKHVIGMDHTPPTQKITTAEKVAETLKKITYDPAIRHKYGLNKEASGE